jgi:Protein of unknown function (DUF2723).
LAARVVSRESVVGSRGSETSAARQYDPRPPTPESLKIRLVTAAIVFISAFALYLKTLAPAIGPTDSGELTSAAWSLGNAHPPGFPFFLILTNLFTRLPLGSIAVRTNIATAFFAALACALVALASAEILLTPRDVRAKAPVEEKKLSKKKQRNVGRTLQSDSINSRTRGCDDGPVSRDPEKV